MWKEITVDDQRFGFWYNDQPFYLGDSNILKRQYFVHEWDEEKNVWICVGNITSQYKSAKKLLQEYMSCDEEDEE